MLAILKRYFWLSLWVLTVILMGQTMPLAIAQNNIPMQDHIGSDESCEHIAEIIEKTFAMPDGILTAITRIEAGRVTDNGSRKGWPWTINHAGKGLFFDSKDDMLAYAQDQLVDGDQNMDIGCMQISHYWHGEHFIDLEEMADPFANVAYAAAFLTDLKTAHGSWDQAIRHYHNADPKQNTPYVKKVYAVWETLGVTPSSAPSSAANDTAQNADIMPSTASLDAFPIDITSPDTVLPDAVITDTSLTIEAAEPVVEQVALPVAPITPTASVEPVAPIEVDPLAELKAKQPHLKGKWDKVEAFRALLNP